MQICYLLNFNNYYNREYKRLNTIWDYEPYIKYNWTNVNFNPGDGITTTIPVNSDVEANYLILSEGIGPGLAGEEIISRWFIIESKFTRLGQRMLTLRRDILVDYSPKSTATVFAERGYVPNTNNLIFNSEGNSYNQIKKKESILKDESASPWLVGYLAPNVFEQGNITVNVSPSVEVAYDYTYASTDAMLQANKYTSLVQGHTVDLDPSVENARFYSSRNQVKRVLWTLNEQFGYIDKEEEQNTYPPENFDILEENEPKAQIYLGENLLGDQNKVAIQDALKIDFNIPTTTEMLDLFSKENKIARVGTASTGYTYYKLIISAQGETVKDVVSPALGALIRFFGEKLQPMITQGIAAGQVPTKYYVKYSASPYAVYWQQITTIQNQITLNADAPAVDKSPYYCFAIPFNSVAVKLGAQMVNTTSALSRQLARNIATQLSSFCYDVQLLPYFPLQSYISNTATIDITEMSSKQYAILKQGEAGGIKSILFWINEPNFSFTIEDSIVYNSQEPKVQNETQFCRLNSTNYAASFEFSVAKNKGVGYWQVDCSYKPYQPYIHVAPNWKGLYGSNFNDARGLICTGDFSIDLMTDRWQEYQIQNKNYNEIFNRQIQSLDLQQSIAQRQEKWGVALGAVQAVAGGVGAGAAIGGGVGAAVGAGLGLFAGAASTAAGLVDIADNNKLRADARSSQIDMFNYHLGNVKALPNTLTKVSTYNINNKIYPFYEIYEATSEEIEALRQQLKWRGYNLGIIGQLSDFQVEGKYFKGKLIRLEENPDSYLGDSHLIENYNSELQQGVYWTKL